MLVKDVMTTKLVRLFPDNSVRQAAETMLVNQVSGLVVIDNDGELVGIISEGDLIRRAELGIADAGADAEVAGSQRDGANDYVKRHAWNVGDTMTRNPVTIDEDATLAKAARLMQEHGIKRIPVTRFGQLVGIVSRADLLKAILVAQPDETMPGDDAIRRSVATRLKENSWLKGYEVTVTVSDGIVHLWGNVDTDECKMAARVASESVRGVKGIVEHFSSPTS